MIQARSSQGSPSKVQHRRVPHVPMAATLLLLLQGAASVSLRAQEAGGFFPSACSQVSPGDPVAFNTVNPAATYSGPLVNIDADTVWIAGDVSPLAFPRSNLTGLQVECMLAEPLGSKAGRGFGIGLLAGGTVGALLGAAGGGDSDVGSGSGAVLGGFVLGGTFALIGAAIGASQKNDRGWVAFPGPGGSGTDLVFSVAPDADPRLGWRVRVSVPVPPKR